MPLTVVVESWIHFFMVRKYLYKLLDGRLKGGLGLRTFGSLEKWRCTVKGVFEGQRDRMSKNFASRWSRFHRIPATRGIFDFS